MIHRIVKYSYCLSLLLLLTSCNFLKSEHYPGKPIKIEEKDIGKEMVWKLNEDNVYHTVILDNNRIKAGNLEWDKEKKIFNAGNQNIILSKLGENCFINVEDGDGMYKILKFTASSDSSIVAYTVNKKMMEKYIKDKILKASIVDNNVVLDLTKIELDDFIDKYCDDIFNYDSPLVFQKLYEKEQKK
jgi:hypothetical protein